MWCGERGERRRSYQYYLDEDMIFTVNPLDKIEDLVPLDGVFSGCYDQTWYLF
jgi:hypothetical protein